VTTPPLLGFWLGRSSYDTVASLQEALHAERKRGSLTDLVLLLEHEPVITLGRGGKLEHLLATEEMLHSRGVELRHTGRGGDITLHAPGQLVCYPILDLTPIKRDVRAYVRLLSSVMRRVAERAGVSAGTLSEHIGLWADAEHPREWPGEELASSPAKLGAIGVKISRWVTMHGFALNLAPDLSLFELIVPCGIREHGTTSVAALGQSAPSVEVAARWALEALAESLGRSAVFESLSGRPSEWLSQIARRASTR
jgi:lipoyl(octanoyl) transferase